MKRLIAIVVLALLAAGPAVACSTDAECNGGRCMKPYGAQQGVCKGGGRQPAWQQQQQQQQQQRQQQAGTCTSDSDCESDQECMQRVDGSAVCMPRGG